MNERIKEFAAKAGWGATSDPYTRQAFDVNMFAELIVKECIDKIETYRIPCGNSPAGEMACEWTYDALKDIRDDIKETFGIKE